MGEIGFSLSAAGLLIYMAGWMRRQAASLPAPPHHCPAQLGLGSTRNGFFTAVAQEGLETVLFLRALWTMQSQLSWIGGLLGLLVAIALGFLLFSLGKRLPMKTFFTISSVLLILIAAGIAAYAMHEILEYGAAQSPLLHEIEEAKAWQLFPPSSQPPAAYGWLYALYEESYFHPPP